MEKNSAIIKKLAIVAIILAVVTISIIAFIGIYSQNSKNNIVQDYTLGTEFEGNREYEFVLDKTESEKQVYLDKDGNVCGEVVNNNESSDLDVKVEGDENVVVNNSQEIDGYTKETRMVKANSDDVLTPEAYKKSKKIIEERLEKIGVQEYNVRLDDESGKMVVELPDDKDTTYYYEVISAQGNFRIIDSENGLELMNNSNVKSVEVTYAKDENYKVYLQVTFNKEGADKLKEISKTYVEKVADNTQASTENAENEENSTATEDKKEIKYIEIKLDDIQLMKTYFGEEMDGGVIQIPLNTSIIDAETFNNTLKSANAISAIINSGKMPNKYSLENDDFLKSSITEKDINIIKYGFVAIILVATVLLVVKFGMNGLLGAILNIGLFSVVSLVVRYTNVTITTGAFVSAILMIVLNSGFLYKLLSNIKNSEKTDISFSKTMKDYYLSIVPLIIVAFVFSFMQSAIISCIGMVLFWGLIIQVLYNVLLTKTVYVLKDK